MTKQQHTPGPWQLASPGSTMFCGDDQSRYYGAKSESPAFQPNAARSGVRAMTRRKEKET